MRKIPTKRTPNTIKSAATSASPSRLPKMRPSRRYRLVLQVFSKKKLLPTILITHQKIMTFRKRIWINF